MESSYTNHEAGSGRDRTPAQIIKSVAVHQGILGGIVSGRRVAMGVLAVFVLLGVYAFVIEPNMIEVNDVQITGSGTEMKIGFIADFQRHNSDPSFVQRVVDMMNERELDIVLIAGDFIERELDEMPSVEPLKGLETRYGVYGVLGNHDYGVYSSNRYNVDLELGDGVKEYMEEGGNMRVLKNESVTAGNVTIIGLDSYWAGLRDLDGALADDPDGFRILVSHNQNNLEISSEIADVYLFGHTHCGQIRLPYIGSVPKVIGFEGEYDHKHYVVDGVDVYTTCGLAPAPRFLAPPEIAIINLT